MNAETESAAGEVYAPAYGTLRRTIEYALFFLIVDRCTRLLAALLGEIPPLETHVPTVTTGAAVALWVMLGLVVLLEARRQFAVNPWDADDLAALRPSERRLAVAGAATAVGAGVVAVGWGTVARLTGDGRAAVAVGQELFEHANSEAGLLAKAAGILGSDVGVLVAFSLGFVALAYGLDRLTLGLVRELIYRRRGRSVPMDGTGGADGDDGADGAGGPGTPGPDS